MGTRSSGVFDAYKLRLASENKSRLQSRYRGFRSLLSGKTVAATCGTAEERGGRGRKSDREKEILACAASRMIRTDMDSRARCCRMGVSLAHDLKS